MSEKVRTKTGRPQKATAQELEEIIQNYYFEYPDTIGERNIAARLANYVKEKNWIVESGKPLCASDFRRDEARAVIEKLVHSRKDCEEKLTIPAFEPLDIESVVSMPLHKQIEVLQQREQVYRNLHIRGSTAIELWMDEMKRRDAREKKLMQTEQELERQQTECQGLKRANKDLESVNRRLRQYLKDSVEPERAKAFLDSLQEKDRKGTAFVETAKLDITSFIQSDVRKISELEEDDPTSLDDLF